MSRDEAYKWLCEQMGLTREKAHIAMFNEQQCRQVIKLCLNRNAE
ncbi:zinc-finger-containing protein [Scytonema sp. UIC 10036]|nr:zinc-finger-containing protein [Scytonema sp. UIC 10036]